MLNAVTSCQAFFSSRNKIGLEDTLDLEAYFKDTIASEKACCPICKKDFASAWAEDFAKHKIVKCKECGLRYVNPRRPYKEYSSLYNKEYFAENNIRYTKTRDLLRKKSIYDRNYHSLLTMLDYLPVNNPSFLDVGTGEGSFLIMLKMHGFENLLGTDINDVNRQKLEKFGIKMHSGNIERLTHHKFDIITIHHVLEHVMKPQELLLQVRTLLSNNGILHLLIPNEGSWNSKYKSLLSKYKINKKPYKHLSAVHHLYFFDQYTIRLLLQENGYKTISVCTRSAEKNRSFVNLLGQREDVQITVSA